MVNSQLKDKLLNHLISGEIKQEIAWDQSILDIPFDIADMLIDQFVDMGLMIKDDKNKHGYTLKLQANAYDFHENGGFAAVEAFKKMQLDKLELELEKLQNKLPDKVKLISSALAAIASVKTAFLK